MKKLLFCSMVAVLAVHQVFAVWAAHLVISPASLVRDAGNASRDRFNAEAAQLARGVTVRPGTKGRVIVSLPAAEDEGPTGKGYYLLVSKKRLASEELSLRSALSETNQVTFGSGRVVTRKVVPEGFVAVRPLRPIQRNGARAIEVDLDREVALRSYVVWDFRVIYEQSAMVMDGGLWLTYDIPAFVEAFAASTKKPEGPKAN